MPLLAITLAVTATLAGCAAADVPATQHSSSHQASASTPKASPTSTSASGVIPVDATVVDSDLGDSIHVTGIVRNFPKPDSIKLDGEVILVQITATAGSKYYAGWSDSSALLFNGAGKQYNPFDLDSLEAPMTAAGYIPFWVANKNDEIDTATTGVSSWVVFIVDDAKGPLSFATRHGAATTSGGGSIPAGTFKVKISD